MDLGLRHLRALCATADAGSVGRAAVHEFLGDLRQLQHMIAQSPHIQAWAARTYKVAQP